MKNEKIEVFDNDHSWLWFEQFYQRSLLGMDYTTNMNECPLSDFKNWCSSKSEHKHTTSVIEVVI